ncbi:hypothetical protein CSPX01_10376 [Colletotrichum filicis]|nr:hypothetical protein CSPX01_10376 [Colletotrichum filicis]
MHNSSAVSSQKSEDGLTPESVTKSSRSIEPSNTSIKANDMQHLRDLVPKIPCQDRFALPMIDFGFRDPGKAQLLAALDNYQPGTPRDFHEPSCFHCGKIHADHGINLKKCGHCQAAWYCGIDCRRTHRKIHKASCKAT